MSMADLVSSDSVLFGCCGCRAYPGQHDMHTYIGLCVGGLEDYVLEMVHRLLPPPWILKTRLCKPSQDPGVSSVLEGHAGCGRIILETDAEPERVVSLPCFSAVLAFVGCAHDIPVGGGTDDMKAKALERIRERVQHSQGWEAALRLWAAFRKREDPLESQKRPLFTFRGSCVRDGRHAFKSTDVYAELGDAVERRFGADDVRVSLKEYDLEVLALILHRHLHVALTLNPKQPWSSGVATDIRKPVLHCTRVAALRSSTAYVLTQLGRPKSGDVLVDFMCGIGTIPMFAALLRNPTLVSMGGDISEDAMIDAVGNLQQLREHDHDAFSRTCILKWDVRHLPMRNACVDMIVVDMPFGLRHKVKDRAVSLFDAAFEQFARCLRPGGRLIALSQKRSEVDHALSKLPGAFVAMSHCPAGELSLRVNIGGLIVALFCLQRTEQPYVQT